MRKQHDGGSAQVFRITGARTGLAEDVRGRQRRYVISMSVRTLAVILAASLWNVERYVAIVALVLGAIIPYIAVVIANAGRERPPSLPSTFAITPTTMAPPTLSPVAEIAPRLPADAHREADGSADPSSAHPESAPGDARTGPEAKPCRDPADGV
ncbi:DUF3099 domain-containing protein [Streptomyces sp. V3I7]|uniref:DUF3099 domain-containing protein n=1 Tax=Streptomyces sp. V3I7 TaxID=3042278 RepID=UPI00277D29CF|nr:DUF3099 domain-containing protein [Streptomyces sp. V3I7]MDQ0990130.1 hypothetical protein [Streptomyces sp. V3I7]